MYKTTGPHCALAIPRQNLVFLLPLMLWLLQSRLTSFEEKVIWNCCLLLHYSIKTKGWPLLFLLLPLTFVLIASWKFLFSTMPADNDNVVTHGAPLKSTPISFDLLTCLHTHIGQIMKYVQSKVSTYHFWNIPNINSIAC